MSYIAEQNVIGSLFLDKNCMDEIYSFLSSDMFTNEILGCIYREFQKGYDNRYEVNAAVIVQNICNDSLPEQIVVSEIKCCMDATTTSATVKSYANVIANEHKTRKLNEILVAIKVTSNDVNGQIGKIITSLEALQDNRSTTSKSLSQIVRENKDKYFKDTEDQKIYIGLPKIDDLLGGLEGGDMIVIGARPAVGKSAFVTQLATYMSDNGKKVGLYNLEMQEKQMYERFVVAKSGIGLTRLRRAKRFLGDEQERFNKANEELEKRENIYITTGSRSVSNIRSESRHMGYDAIIIDYMQLLKSDKTYGGNRTAEVGAISKAIKALAMELNIPIIALSQLNRVSEMKDTKEPTMAELREAGDIEQDASVIMLMWNISQDDTSKKGLKIEKQRQGKTGKVVLNFNGDLMRFEETEESVSDAQKWSKKIEDDCPFK